jgi:DNA-binding response OmpR family regulator
MRILLLDDGVDGTEKLLEWFSECGDIEMASVIKTRELFLEKAVSERPDAVFIHTGRAGFPGFKTGEALRAAGNRVPIVFLSAEKKSALAAFEAGADGFLLCPVEMGKVKRCVENLKKCANTPAENG